ncbi:MAG: hypothetical protein GKS02_13335 [Alphaproteobacteria bacterium]|nr:hypothetical protein [Alphaproteobacteria bacterium]
MLSASKFSPNYLICTALIALALTLSQPGAFAATGLDTLDKGPAIGTAIPHPLTAPDQTNENRDFSALTGKNGLIVLFSRSFDW